MNVNVILVKLWKTSYSNPRILETKDLLSIVSNELQLLSKIAFGAQLKNFSLVDLFLWKLPSSS